MSQVILKPFMLSQVNLDAWFADYCEEKGLTIEFGPPNFCDTNGYPYYVVCIGGTKPEGHPLPYWVDMWDCEDEKSAYDKFGHSLTQFLGSCNHLIIRRPIELRCRTVTEFGSTRNEFQITMRLVARNVG